METRGQEFRSVDLGAALRSQGSGAGQQRFANLLLAMGVRMD